ncbi:tRNA pseudouridine(55) synthase TruB [Ursidibacter maritimus]|uniref:tRNA pseudouridine synthase B n=1 Tax=Ursidibacter maritimus TaxID=1331689 RepID=A0A949WG97_9PAST|nr:tRNA pseudouridine(55) synthase TruB [Ursidibacter maritimus]KAE9539210.1 tRNA pseudouridine(55) synthase TruB [Ursidibacter maritimus]MBV6523967.1 tRNA pseudouridine(55) synthase TruB [Ursidibacter maritimus]MBV6525462.1 tRNA pseudouridine(55) synthase TruB [Ursidibacter maritimus]MBV6526932.1 tRNA pseudouridine(55) synthase TruB [Ursidibacter maritimus]MBV6530207.1 tRNA pseudouridine(55) synthase TruB [Ursidibacter maritimus]
MSRPKKKGRDIHGVFLLDKPEGVSSNDIMQKVKRLFRANKAGHTGALDPLATGMLPICLGEATKFSQFLLDSDKRYRVTAKLGERTDTSDAEGQIVQSRSINVNEAEILTALEQFRGDILQVPTMFSALKHQGKPLYEYARAGITVEREARPITIFELKFIDYQAPFLTLEVHCSKGTYIRTLVDDLGEVLGCGAHVTVLRRLAVANYPSNEMLTIDALQKIAEMQPLAELTDNLSLAMDKHLLPMDSAVDCLPILNLTAEQTKAVGYGQRVKFENTEQVYGQVRLYSAQKQFLGVAEVDLNNVIRPSRMVNI